MAVAAPPRARKQGSVSHPSLEERARNGKIARAKVPRSTLALFEPGLSRPDPVALLEEQAGSRVPELVPIRYGRMLLSPFAFFRGAALGMAADLAATPTSGLTVQACGDAHLSNFGVFGSPDRTLVFDVNDFDETLPGPWEWDVKRLASSLAIAGRERGFTNKERAIVVTAAAEGYRTEMAALAGLGDLAVWYRRGDVTQLLADFRSVAKAADRKRTKAAVAKARTRDSMQAYSKLTHIVDGEPRIISDPPLIVPIEELVPGLEGEDFLEWAGTALRTYRRTLQDDRRHLLEQFRFVHLARKVVGVGSVGTRAWIALMLGRDDSDPLFLQIKEAQASVLERFTAKSRFDNQGERVVAGQRVMQAASDIFLGWERLEGLDGETRDFYIRQLRDWKGSVDMDQATPTSLRNYARVCGWTLARAHARSGDRIAIAAYLGKSTAFDQAVAAFAELYADQNEKDYASLQKTAADGRITVESGL